MNTSWTSIVDDVQEYLSTGISALPHVYVAYLNALREMEQTHKVCLLPSPRFELYHATLEQRLKARLQRRRAA